MLWGQQFRKALYLHIYIIKIIKKAIKTREPDGPKAPSPDLLNNVKIGQGQLKLIMKHFLFYHIWGLQPFWSSDLKQS